MICYKAEQRMVSMPSQIVDEAWHEFILFTKEYSDFCSQGFGYFLHHTPAEAMKTGTQGQQGIRLAWELACQKDHINSYRPKRLPLLFAIDTLLEIENGFYYTLDCFQHKKTSPENSISSYCVTDIIYGVGCGGHSDSYDHSVDTNTHHSTIDHTSCGSGHSCGSSCGSSCGGGCGGGCGGC
ncbi:hypothetical protein [Cyanothece sp. BG0011]|uniref:glycine-rich domain-containing protein n=1 Tax=Cyanothece sp. BG0011 TaxID=2082950 RepID=UPI0018E5061B|nr:hypothetical protein [Cyanothece sp. BG0011]